MAKETENQSNKVDEVIKKYCLLYTSDAADE